MAFAIDHIFICVEVGAPEAGRLKSFGLTEGTSNTHPGQGTACRRFFFENAYLELLWVQAPVEAQSEQSRPTRLWERWSGRNGAACPFGLCIRPVTGRVDDIPFPTWQYRPAYLPAEVSLGIAKNSEVMTEPMLFYLTPSRRPDDYSTDRQQPLTHTAGLRQITRVSLASPRAERISPELQALIDMKLVELCAGNKYCVEIGFDGETQQGAIDLRPTLPLVIRW